MLKVEKSKYDHKIFSTGDSSNSLETEGGYFAYVPNTDINMTDSYAYISDSLMLVVWNKEKIGFRCSHQASINLQKSKRGTNVYSVKIADEIVWVTSEEFKKYNLIEYSVPKSKFKGK